MQFQPNDANDAPEKQDVASNADDLMDDAEATAKSLADSVAKDAKEQEKNKTIEITVAEYEKLKTELDEAKDRGLRALAELENFRARTDRLAKEERKYAAMDLARDVLPVFDNLERALDIKEPEKNAAAIVDGVRMVRQEFLNAFSKNGIERIESVNLPFDPKFHESVAFVPNAELSPNTVAFELKAGFKLHERVVRAAQVVLAAPVPGAAESQPKEATESK